MTLAGCVAVGVGARLAAALASFSSLGRGVFTDRASAIASAATSMSKLIGPSNGCGAKIPGEGRSKFRSPGVLGGAWFDRSVDVGPIGADAEGLIARGVNDKAPSSGILKLRDLGMSGFGGGAFSPPTVMVAAPDTAVGVDWVGIVDVCGCAAAPAEPGVVFVDALPAAGLTSGGGT